MSNPVTTSFGFAIGGDGFGWAYNVQVPSGSLATALRVPLFGEQGSPSKIYDSEFVSLGFRDLSVTLDSVVPVGSTLRTNLYNATQNLYLINVDIAAGSGSNDSTGSLSVAAGDQVYLLLVDILGSGFLVPRLQWDV